MTANRRDAEPASQRDKGRKPLKRGRAGPAVRTAPAITDGPSMIRDARDSMPEYPTTTAPNTGAERRRKRVRARGDAHRRTGGPFGSVTLQSQSQEGRLRREAKAILVVSSSEGRTPRARLVENARETRTGAMRRSRQERQGRNMTRRRQLRGWWLVQVGLR